MQLNTERSPPLNEQRHDPTIPVLNRVLSGLDRPGPHNLSSRSRLEHSRLFCERIDALPRFGGRFLDDNEFRKPRYKKNARLLEFFVAHGDHAFDDRLYIFFAQLSVLSDFFNQLRFRHLRCHADPLLDLSIIEIGNSRMPRLPFDARAEPLPELQELLFLALGLCLALFLRGLLSPSDLIVLSRKTVTLALHLIRA